MLVGTVWSMKNDDLRPWIPEGAARIRTASLLIPVLAPLTGCSATQMSPPAQLEFPPGSINSLADVQNATGHKDWLIGSFPVCLDRPGEVHVTGVVSEDGNVQVVGYGLRPNPGMTGGAMVGTWPADVKAPDPITTQAKESLTYVCGTATTDFYELVVTVRAGTVNTHTDGFIAHFDSGGTTGQLVMPHEVTLCVRATDAGCAAVFTH